ncbi:50S ribosomal protein L32 [Aeromicrobium sp. Root495]|uniref:50S ribosomal protein L32 n=1 Tax=Aeromicrobium sp. Root495 TaxID=1736550 RepID=UPI0006FB2ABD|nr:50S ribosomal protein L32 [Aeromicrobium sp. Root495]KQY60384.1 50S ribosomal protein L32 [Aeromicrobium sp. Root495]
MAVPKRKTSRSNTRHRRSQWKASAPDLVPVRLGSGPDAGRTVHVPRRLVRAVQRGLVPAPDADRSTTPPRRNP